MGIINTYKVSESARVYFNGESEIRFRKGIWNYEEAILDANYFDGSMKEAVIDIFQALSEEKTIDIADYHMKYQFSSDENAMLLDLLDQLSEQEYLTDGSNEDLEKLVKALIGGTTSQGLLGAGNSRLRQVLAVVDTEAMRRNITLLAEQVGLPLTIMDEDDFNRISQVNLVDKLDAIDTISKMNDFKMTFEPYSCVIVSMERPRVKFLRNLNRILLSMSKPFVLSLLDGPFLSIMTIKGNETACFECFENRVMARMEDMSAYKNFVNQTGGTMAVREKTYATPILQTMTSLAVFEALLIASINKAKLAGRLINIYIPLLEIQIQDLLRVPFCPACGHIAKAQYDEMYTSSKKIVDSLIKKVEIIRK